MLTEVFTVMEVVEGKISGCTAFVDRPEAYEFFSKLVGENNTNYDDDGEEYTLINDEELAKMLEQGEFYNGDYGVTLMTADLVSDENP